MAKSETIVGAVLGNCRIVKRLGEGAQSVVYLARHQLLDKEVAIKILSQSVIVDKQQLTRFLQEARSAARLEHPNIVQVHDAGSEGETHYMVMQCVNGPSLDQRIRRKGPMKPAEAAEMALQLADALAVAHKEKIIHRDIKPGNILFTKTGVPKLADFGMARDTRKGFDITTPGVAVGTPMFMPPEQADGKPADGRSDLFSLGCVLYFVLTGKPPFNGDTLVEVLRKVLQEEPPEEPLNRARVPPGLRQVIKKLMEKDPKNRYQSAEEVIEALEGYLVGGGGPSRTALRLRAAASKVTARYAKSPSAAGRPWMGRMFWPSIACAALAWFALGVVGQAAIADLEPGLAQSLVLPWTTGAGNVAVMTALLAAAAGLTFAALRLGRGRFEGAEHPLASKTVMVSTGLLIYAWSVSKSNDAADGLLARAAETAASIASSFPGHAASLLFAAACLVSVAMLRTWILTKWLGWLLSIVAVLAAVWGGAQSARPESSIASVFSAPGGGPWPALVCLLIAGVLLAIAHRRFWEGLRPSLWVTLGLAAMAAAVAVAAGGGAIDLLREEWGWLESMGTPWTTLSEAAMRDGALWVLAAAAAAWTVALTCQRAGTAQ
jgi:tRNA A-37 threonylcarbamoyl transferase component Bud32